MLQRPLVSIRLLLLSLTVVVLAACSVQASSGPTPEPPTPTPVQYASVIESARTAMDAVTSFRWESEYEAAGSDDAPPFRARYEGVWVEGDLDYVATYFIEGDPIVQRNIYVDGRAFRRVEGVWQEQTELVPVGLPAWDDRSPVPQLDRGNASETPDGNWLVEGKRVFESQTADWSITYDVTVLVADADKHLISTSIETSATNGDTSSTSIEFSDYNNVPTISLPEAPIGP